jgi:integrase
MNGRYRLFLRSNGIYYREDAITRKQTSLKTRSRGEARQILGIWNQQATSIAINREVAKAYLVIHEPEFCARTWAAVARVIAQRYVGSTRLRWKKFLRSVPLRRLLRKKLVDTEAEDFLRVLYHRKAGVSTNIFLRTLHNYAVELGWVLKPVLPKSVWPRIRHPQRRGITANEHGILVSMTKNREYRLYFQLLWETGGSQTDIARLDASDIDWQARRLYYQRQRHRERDGGRVSIAVGSSLAAILRQLPSKGPLFPKIGRLREDRRASYFAKIRKRALLPKELILHSYRYAWAERARAADMPENEAMAHLGHTSKAVHRAYARRAETVTMPLEYYEALKAQRLQALQGQAGLTKAQNTDCL